MAALKILSLIAFALTTFAYARHQVPKHRIVHPGHLFHRHRHFLRRHIITDPDSNVSHHSFKRSERIEDSSNNVWLQHEHKHPVIVKGLDPVGSEQDEKPLKPTDDSDENESLPKPNPGETLPGQSGERTVGTATTNPTR